MSSDDFESDREDIISHAADKGIAIISSAIVPGEWQKCVQLARDFPSVHAAIGLDPELYGDIDLVKSWIGSNSEHIVAVGETGLDHYIVRNHKKRAEQAHAFRQLIGLAKDLGLPVQVHSRSAGRRALEVLYECEADAVHMHAFDGRRSLARSASHDHGYYFSVPTSVVRSQQKRKLVKAISIERILLETDSPVLGPDRGERNTPLNIFLALEETARILRREPEELREILLENTLRLYKQMNYL
jgi:TatD DNase family protein